MDKEDQKKTQVDQKHHCQVLWAKNKYLALYIDRQLRDMDF